VRVLCAKFFKIAPTFEPLGPNLETMLASHDAALMIGDPALFEPRTTSREVIDLGETWFRFTGLPFVYAFWAGRPDALTPAQVKELQHTRDVGLADAAIVAREYLKDAPERQALGARYLRENIKYYLGEEEKAGLEQFYRYAAEIGAAPRGGLRFYGP
jgi:chorismate dehydratase